MKDASETGPSRSGTRYSAAGKLKAVKLYFEEGYQARDIARELGSGIVMCGNQWFWFSVKKATDTFSRVKRLTVNKSKIAWKILIANQNF